MYLLDTNVVSELRRPRPHRAVVEWVAATDHRTLFLSAVTMGEIQAGIESIRGHDEARAIELQDWADMVQQNSNVLPMDGDTFRLWARLMHRKQQHLYEDAMIAATALQNDLVVATRNAGDFVQFGVRTIDPFAG
jgi:predicted nucleic acid-binding protein